MLCYCRKCGRVILFLFDKDEKICDCCKSEVFPIPKQYLDGEFSLKKELEQQFIDEYIKTAPEFDQYLFDNRDKILSQKSAGASVDFYKENGEIKARVSSSSTSNVPKCPTCQSTNIRKIGGVERGASVAMLGLFSKKINKSFKCNNCGYTW